MGSKETGGPAFPAKRNSMSVYQGMTLRDYFAGQALVGLLSNETNSSDKNGFARASYKIADAMMEARG